ncbi:MAG: sulfotransferase [Opitutales bacterium]|nr:sulfotransferase [Opitutales bacterium]
MSLLHTLRLAAAGRLPAWTKAAFLKLRELDAGQRALPDFLIIGAMKAGTTSLFNYLCMHPQVIGSVPKEIFYFCSHPGRGERWYRRHFPRRRQLAAKGALCGEATPTYLASSEAPIRAHALIPQAKLLALLREPAARAVSHYHHRCRAGRESRSVDEVFSPSMVARIEAGCPDGETETLLYERSLYSRGLRPWLEAYPRDQILVLEAETLFANPQVTVNRVVEFIGLEPFSLPAATAYNAAGSKTPLPQSFDRLAAAFAKLNQDLPAMGISCSWLKNG